MLMKTMRVLVILMFVVSLATVISAQAERIKFTNSAKIETVNEMKFQKREHKESRRNNAGIEIQVDYPELIGRGAAGKIFNKEVKSLVLGKVSQAKVDFEMRREDILLNAERKEFYSFLMSHYIDVSDENYVVIRFVFYEGAATEGDGGIEIEVEDTSRAIHLSFDLKRQKTIKLTDLFNPGSGYLNLISNQFVAARLEEGQSKEEAEKIKIELEKRGFQYWGLSNNGLKLNLEIDDGDGYVETFPEVIIPYEKFPPAMRSAVFGDFQASVNKGRKTSNICTPDESEAIKDNTALRFGKVKGAKNARAYFYKCDSSKPKAKPRRALSYIISGDEVVVSRVKEGFAYVSFPRKNKIDVDGWISLSKLGISKTDENPRASSWFGKWEYNDGVTYSANLEIGPANGSNYLMISGSASYLYGSKEDREKNGSINFGTIGEDEGDGEIVKPEGNKFILSPNDYEDCEIKAQLVGKFLVVSDNYKCGGRNVTYSGIYRRKP